MTAIYYVNATCLLFGDIETEYELKFKIKYNDTLKDLEDDFRNYCFKYIKKIYPNLMLLKIINYYRE